MADYNKNNDTQKSTQQQNPNQNRDKMGKSNDSTVQRSGSNDQQRDVGKQGPKNI